MGFELKFTFDCFSEKSLPKPEHKYLLKRVQPDFIDIKDHHGRCPLHCAAIFANVEAVKVLLKANANPDQCDELGMTPLHYAAENPNGVKEGTQLYFCRVVTRILYPGYILFS